MRQIKVLNKPKKVNIIPVRVETEFFFVSNNQSLPVNKGAK